MENTVAIYGLDEEYMRRLALYVNDRSEGRFCLNIVDENDFEKSTLKTWVVPSSMREAVLGSRDVENDFSKGDAGNNLTKDDACSDRGREYIFFTEDTPNDGEIHMYMGCDAIYRALKRRISMSEKSENRTRYLTDKRWYCFVSDERTCFTMKFWNVLSAVIAADKRVLVLHMSPLGKGVPKYSEWTDILDVDMSDLILALRKEKQVSIEGYGKRYYAREYADNLPEKYDEMVVDVIPEFDNPVYFYEITDEDIAKLISAIDSETAYDCILVMMTDMFSGCERFLLRADKVIECTEGGKEPGSYGFWGRVIHNLDEAEKALRRDVGTRPSDYVKNSEKLWADLRLEERGLRCGER